MGHIRGKAVNINCPIDDRMVIITCKEKNGVGEE